MGRGRAGHVPQGCSPLEVPIYGQVLWGLIPGTLRLFLVLPSGDRGKRSPGQLCPQGQLQAPSGVLPQASEERCVS